jgi:hypothetical protein
MVGENGEPAGINNYTCTRALLCQNMIEDSRHSDREYQNPKFGDTRVLVLSAYRSGSLPVDFS